jgi:hypothetical protein
MKTGSRLNLYFVVENLVLWARIFTLTAESQSTQRIFLLSAEQLYCEQHK